jgi:hypothetical protein
MFLPVDLHNIDVSLGSAAWFDLGYLPTKAQRPNFYLEK